MSKRKAAAMMEFRTVKRIDNSRLVRHVEPAKQRNLFKTAGLGGVVALFFLFFVLMTALAFLPLDGRRQTLRTPQFCAS